MERITSVVYDAIDELNEQFAEENRLEKAPATVLLGNAGRLDSVCQARIGTRYSGSETGGILTVWRMIWGCPRRTPGIRTT
jgi:hypothetical protein